MNLDTRLDNYLRRHPRLFLLIVIALTVLAGIVLLGTEHDVGLVYKAF